MTRDEAVRYAFTELHQTFFDELHALMAKVDARARAEEREACLDIVSKSICFNDCECHDAIRAREENP